MELKREGMYVYLGLTHISCMAEANTTLLSNYLQLKKPQQTVFSCTGSLGKKYVSQLFNNRVVLVQGFSWSYNTAWFFRLVTAPLGLQKLFTRLLLWLLVLLVVISHWLLVGGVSSLPLGCSHYGRLLSRKRGREKKTCMQESLPKQKSWSFL